MRLGIGELPFLVFVPDIDRAGFWPPPPRLLPVEAQRELEERDAVSAAPRLLIGFGAHEIADDCDVRIGDIIGELLLPLGERVVIGVHPGMRRIGRQELERERAEAAPPRHLDRLKRRAGDP